VEVGSQRSLPIVGVMGSGSTANVERCRALGVWLAEHELHLLTGGGAGAMAAVSEGFASVPNRAGLVIGVLPAVDRGVGRAPDGYPNPFVEIPIRTHLHLSGRRGTEVESRNHINVLSSDVIVALPGSWGTRSEVSLAVRYEKPIVAYLGRRRDIPELPETVPVVHDLDTLGRWVLRALGRAP
jgi:uncharacterized protein (TIGR00725 family)